MTAIVCSALLMDGRARAQDDPLALLLDSFGARWGDKAADVRQKLAIPARRIEPPLDYGIYAAPLAISDFRLLEQRFLIFFQFDKRDGELRQILMQRRRADGERAAFERLKAALQERLGEPADRCANPAKAAVSRNALRWTSEQRTIRLVFFDYRHRGIIIEGEPLTDDPTVPWYKRQSLDPASLPTRVLIRITPPGDTDPGC